MKKVSVLDQLRADRAGTAPEANDARTASRDQPLVGCYERISDAYEGRDIGVTTDGVDRQKFANIRITEARGWQIFRHYTDNDVTAYQEGVTRDEFEALLDDLDRGIIDGIVCYNLDRFARRVDDLERAIAIYDKARREKRTLHFATAEGDLNLASDDGLTMARVMVAFANKSSRDSGRRISLKWQHVRDAGEVVSGGTRAFGWDIVKVDGKRLRLVNESEAALVRDAVTRLTNRTVTFRGIVREWNEAGVLTTRGNPWNHTTLSEYLQNPRLAGWQVHNGNIAVHSQTGKLIRGNFEPILTDDEYEAFLVAADKVRSATPGAAAGLQSGHKKYLLSGLLRCAKCGNKLVGCRRKVGQKTYHYYICRSEVNNQDIVRGCNQMSVSGRAMDELVTELVLPRIVQDTQGAYLDTERPYQQELHDLQAEKERLLAAYRNEDASSELVFPKVTQIEQQMSALRDAQAAWFRDKRRRESAVGVTVDSWPALTIEERRAHIERHLEAVFISPSPYKNHRNRKAFQHERVSPPVWRSQSSSAELLAAVGQ